MDLDDFNSASSTSSNGESTVPERLDKRNSSLLGKICRDRCSLHVVEIVGYDSTTGLYRAEVLDSEAEPFDKNFCYEVGATIERHSTDLLPVSHAAIAEPRRPGGIADPKKGRQHLVWCPVAGRLIAKS